MKNYYRDMDLSENATQDEIRGQFKRLAKEFHPDKNTSDYASQRFAQVNEAYNVLNDPQKRQEYDFQRKSFYHFQREQRTQQQHSQNFDSFFASPMWSNMKNFASGMAKNIVQDLDREIRDEFTDVDPFVERVTNLKVRHNNSGSVSVNCTISEENLREITSMASRGMDVEEFSADVGTLFASALSQALMQKWRGY
jgi:DnaJ-class molecular chaperone